MPVVLAHLRQDERRWIVAECGRLEIVYESRTMRQHVLERRMGPGEKLALALCGAAMPYRRFVPNAYRRVGRGLCSKCALALLHGRALEDDRLVEINSRDRGRRSREGHRVTESQACPHRRTCDSRRGGRSSLATERTP